MFSALDAILLRPLPYPEPSRLVSVWEHDRLNQSPRYRRRRQTGTTGTGTRTFENLAAYISGGGARCRPAVTRSMSPFPSSRTNFFDVMGVRPLLGRTFTRADYATPPIIASWS